MARDFLFEWGGGKQTEQIGGHLFKLDSYYQNPDIFYRW